MRIRRHAPQQEETGIDLAPMQRISTVMNLLCHASFGGVMSGNTLVLVHEEN